MSSDESAESTSATSVSDGVSADLAQALAALADEQAALREGFERLAAAVRPLLTRQYDETLVRVRALESKIRARQERPVVVRVAALLNDVGRLASGDDVKAHVEETLHSLLADLGYQLFGAVGDQYDAQWHEPIAGSAGEGTVVTRVHVRGLSCFGDILSKAKVEVAPAPRESVAV